MAIYNFSLHGINLEFTDADREYGILYHTCLKTGTQSLNEFEATFNKVVRKINETNKQDLILTLATEIARPCGEISSIIWDFCLKKKQYSLVKSDISVKLATQWLQRLIENTKGFMILKCTVQIIGHEDIDFDYLYKWIIELKNDLHEIKEICDGMRNALNIFFVYDVSNLLNQYQILETDYNFNKFWNATTNINNVGLSADNLSNWIENIRLFPHIKYSYTEIIKYFGDSQEEIQAISKFLGFENAITDYKNSLLKSIAPPEIFTTTLDKFDEEWLIQQRDAISERKLFLGITTPVDYLTNIEKKLEEIDINERTVNGKEYTTREEATEVRQRSFDGKEYESIEAMQKVKYEIDYIRDTLNGKNLLQQHQAYTTLINDKWDTPESQEELTKIKKQLNDDYYTLSQTASKKENLKKSTTLVVIIALAVIVISYFCIASKFLRSLVWVIAALVAFETFSKYKGSCEAQVLLEEINSYRDSVEWKKEP